MNPTTHGTRVISIRVGGRTYARLERIAASYETSIGQLSRFVLSGVNEADVKRLLFAAISRINDEDRDDPPEDAPEEADASPTESEREAHADGTAEDV